MEIVQLKLFSALINIRITVYEKCQSMCSVVTNFTHIMLNFQITMQNNILKQGTNKFTYHQ